MYLYYFYAEIRITEMKRDLSNGKLMHKQREKKCSSAVWKKFHEIFTADTEEKIDFFYLCTDCKDVIYNPTKDGNTNRLWRHNCAVSGDSGSSTSNKKHTFTLLEKERKGLRVASAKFVAKDLRPSYAIERPGLLDLCEECMIFGQTHKKATREDLKYALPSRTSVQTEIAEMAKSYKENVSEMLKQAMESGGIGATTDTWTDDYRKTTYISVVAHISIYTGTDIKYDRFVLATNEVPEAIKEG